MTKVDFKPILAMWHWNPEVDYKLGHELDQEIIPTKEEIMKFRLRMKSIKMRKSE